MTAGPRPLPRHPHAAGPSLDDGALVARLADGDGAALDLLVARHGSRVANFLGHVLDDRSWIDDLTQEVFVRLCAHAHRFDPRFELSVWLLRVARNLAVDLMRREAARRRAHGRFEESHDLEPPAQPDRAAEDAEFRAAFEDALRQLPEPFRTVFVLKEIELLGYGEIAAVVGTNEKTVSTRLHRARHRMRALLKEWLEP